MFVRSLIKQVSSHRRWRDFIAERPSIPRKIIRFVHREWIRIEQRFNLFRYSLSEPIRGLYFVVVRKPTAQGLEGKTYRKLGERNPLLTKEGILRRRRRWGGRSRVRFQCERPP